MKALVVFLILCHSVFGQSVLREQVQSADKNYDERNRGISKGYSIQATMYKNGEMKIVKKDSTNNPLPARKEERYSYLKYPDKVEKKK